jgi:hypothetical protein
MPSKHLRAGNLIRRGLYDDLQSFSVSERRISVLGDENSKTVGDAFEVFVEGYLATHQKLQAQEVWLVGLLPPDIREQHRRHIPNADKHARPISGQIQVAARIPDLFRSCAIPWANRESSRPHCIH